MAMTLGEFHRVRGTNGSTPPTPVLQDEAPRRCESCGKALTAKQKRTCSPACSSQLGRAHAAVRNREAAAERHGRPDLLGVLDHLPSYVDAVEVPGWRCVRVV